MEYLCAICQNPYRPRKVTEMFCNGCYTRYKESILNKEAWVQYCVANEQARRNWNSYIKKGKRVWVELIHLNGKFDIAVVNGKTELVPTREYYNEVE